MEKTNSTIADIALNPVMLNSVRLKIMFVLIRDGECSFVQLLKETNATKGNISVQLKKLSALEYIVITRSFQNNYPYTLCRISAKGIDAMNDYKDSLNDLLALINR